MSDQPLQVSVREVIASKNANLLRWIPEFVLRWFERFVHQDELNRVLRTYHGYDGREFAIKAIEEMGSTVAINFSERIPKEGPVVFVANHPMAGLDALCLFAEVGKVRSKLHIIANDVLTHIPQFKGYFVPVNKFGKSAKDSMVRVDRAYAEREAMIVFPAGLCSRKIDNKIVDLEWQKSFLAKAIQYNYTIVPVYIDGANSSRFYRIANWRKFWRIKFNIEMMTLADELFLKRGQTITLTFGNPIDSSLFDKRNTLVEAQYIKEFVYRLQEDPNATFALP
ncbi:MAG: glycerol acyltransferase [Sphingomonadales bacterium]|nr:glycerol acyltransferase [Sphingomonadales bacterium]